tara:strand:- start:15910 stop:16629 length:720 start_codon:yes stop_codon:yes gene_type:complete
MKVFILAGGFGTRLSEFTKTIPKPMVHVNGYPIIVHIMKHYLKYNLNEFYIAVGYKGEKIKKYFKNFKKDGELFEQVLFKKKCKIAVVNTGLGTLTGGRLKRLKRFVQKNENFMFTYGDGVSDVNLNKLIKFHNKQKRLITVTAVRPPARFGELIIQKNSVTSFKEKPQVKDGWINGGYFLAKYDFLNLIRSDKEILEKRPLEIASKKRQLSAYKHFGFWKCMDTLRDKQVLEDILKNK